MTQSVTLDWIAFTWKRRTHASETWLNQFASSEIRNTEQPRHGYDTAFRTKDNVVCSWHSSREEMGVHVIIPGSSIATITRKHNINQWALLKSVIDAGGLLTRLDIAKDVQEVTINLRAIWEKIRKKEYEGTARTTSAIESGDGAITIYVGSRQSERFIRIYDKAAQLGITDGRWKRYEIECKGMVARALGCLLVDGDRWGGAFDAMALAMVSIPNSQDYQAFFPRGVALVSIPKIEKTSDREAWILSQCLPAIVTHYQENRTSDAIRLLREALSLIDRVD